MKRDSQIQLDTHSHYQLTQPSSFIAGRVQAHRNGYGFLVRDDGKKNLFLPQTEMQKVMHNDRVLARIVGYDKYERPEGRIDEIAHHANQHVIGRLFKENGALIVAPEDKRIGHNIFVTQNVQKAQIGQVVVVELTNFPSLQSKALGHVTEVLGNIDDPGIEIEIAVRKYGVPHEFSQATLDEVARLPEELRPTDIQQHRVDLRNVPLVTIDGEEAHDFDDAVYCEPITTGYGKGFRLIIAIADVSYYVQPESGLDIDAIMRSTSVYFPRRVIPMLPEKLSNGLCSLSPHVDRNVLVCDMVITAHGTIKAYQFYPGVIHSAARLTYTEVAAVLKNKNGPEARCRAPLLTHLQNLHSVYRAFSIARQKRGATDFNITETYIVCNAQGKIEKIMPRVRDDTHKLIEECMLAANVCAADFIKRSQHPGLYRVHASPTAEKLENLRIFLRSIGLTFSDSNLLHMSDYTALMLHIRGRPDAQILQTMLLRSMQQAIYSPHNIGHFGLAYKAYTHFTSPIRRYPDLLTHRAIYAILRGQQYQPKVPSGVVLNTLLFPVARVLQQENEDKKHDRRLRVNTTIWEKLGQHCSVNERRADEVSRDVETWLKCYFMRNKLGEEYDGIVSGVTSFGIFVQLDAFFVEGLVHVTELGSDYFQYDELENELRGEHTGIRYRLADRVRVQVSYVNLEARQIDLRLIHDTLLKSSANLIPHSKKTTAESNDFRIQIPSPCINVIKIADKRTVARTKDKKQLHKKQ